MDQTTAVGKLKQLVEEFVAARDWQQFHTPKNLSMGLAVEAAELMDLFKWHSGPDSLRLLRQKTIRRDVREELADVVIYCLAFANRAGIDISQAVRYKIAKNRRKYPIRSYRSRFSEKSF